MKKIALLKPFENHSAGDILEVSSKVANELIDSGVARVALTRDFLVKPEFGSSKALGIAPKRTMYRKRK